METSHDSGVASWRDCLNDGQWVTMQTPTCSQLPASSMEHPTGVVSYSLTLYRLPQMLYENVSLPLSCFTSHTTDYRLHIRHESFPPFPHVLFCQVTPLY